MARLWMLIAGGLLLVAAPDSIAAQETSDKPLVFRDDLSAGEKQPFDAIADLAKELTENEADQLRLRLAFTEALLALDVRKRLVDERPDTRAMEAILRRAAPSMALSVPGVQGVPTPARHDDEDPRARLRNEIPRLGAAGPEVDDVHPERERAENLDLYRSEEWVRNMNLLLDQDPTSVAPRIYGGGGRLVTDLKDCVAIGVYGGGAFSSCCTGTLIARNAVLTAAHCVPCRPTHIFVGSDTGKATAGTVYRIQGAPRVHHSYTEAGKIHDLTILFLQQDVSEANVKKVRELATIAQLRQHGRYLTVAGFGHTETGVYGKKFETKVAVSSLTSRTEEIVAGGNNSHDTCQGDSGGPAYLELPNQKRLLLAGVTSRGGRCGTGGIYTRVAIDEPHGQWILQNVPALRSLPGAGAAAAPDEATAADTAPALAAPPALVPEAPRARPPRGALPASDEDDPK